LTDIKNKVIYITNDYMTFRKYGPLSWQPSYIAYHPTDSKRIMGYDKVQKKVNFSFTGPFLAHVVFSFVRKTLFHGRVQGRR